MVGVFTPQKLANTSNQGTTVQADIPESPPSSGWPRTEQLAQTPCPAACSATGCFPGTPP